jgi:hypothetical protein
MTEILLSIILLFGMPGGPTNDFNDTSATNEPVTTSQQHSE